MKQKPKRHGDESPLEFYTRTRCCPDDYLSPYEGRFYCNPAHCDQSWESKSDRDEHLTGAYSILD